MKLFNAEEYDANQDHPSVFPWRVSGSGRGCTVVDAKGQTVCIMSKGTASIQKANAEFIVGAANAAYEAAGRAE